MRLGLFAIPLLAAAGPVGAQPATDLFGDPLPPGAVARLGTARLSGCRSMAYAPDGKTLAVARDRDVQLWEVAGHRLLDTLPSSLGVDGSGITFSPDGGRLAVIGFGGMPVDLWDLKARKKGTFKEGGRSGGPDWSAAAVFSADRKTLFVTTSTMLFHLDAATAAKRKAFPLADGRHRIVAFSPDGKYLAGESPVDGRKKQIHLYDVATGTALPPLNIEQDYTDVFRFSADTKYLAVGGHYLNDPRADSVSLWEVATAKHVRDFTAPGRIWSVAFTRDGQTLFAGHERKSIFERVDEAAVCAWDVTKPEKPTRRYPSFGLNDLVLSPDEKTITWRCCDQTVRFLDRATGEEFHPVAGHRGPIQALTYSPDGKSIASGSEDGAIRVWAADTAKPLVLMLGHASEVRTLAYSPDGATLASGSRDTTALLWDVAAGKKRLDLPEQGNQVRGVAFSPSGDVVATGGYARVALADPKTGKRVGNIPFYAECVVWSPDGKVIVAGGTGREVAWLNREGNRLRELKTPDRVTSLARSPDGRLLVVGCDERSLVVEFATAKVLMTLPGHSNQRGAVAFSPDGRYIASVGDGWNRPNNPQTIQVFETQTGKEVRPFERTEPVLAVAFSPDGRRLVTGGSDTSALVWDLYNLSGAKHPATLTDAAAEAHWAALADPDPAKAYPARVGLIHAPASAVALLAKRLQPVARADPDEVTKAIRDLDANEFRARERAQARLAELGDVAEPALRAALARGPAAEARERIEKLLSGLPPIPRTRPEHLRTSRAIEVLERINTREARAVLEALARGNPESPLTREAVAALGRGAVPGR